MKKLLTTATAVLIAFAALAQSGGVKGSVVDRQGRAPIGDARIVLSQKGETVAKSASGRDGRFLIGSLADGMYDMIVTADGYNDLVVNVTVDKGFVKDMMFLTMTASQTIAEVDDSSFTEFDMDDSGYTDTPTILFGSNDVYSDIAGYGFSAIRFKNRGYNSETQDVYLSGIRLNDAITGYTPYSLWSGLNEAMRAKETTMGLEPYSEGIGRFNGVTNILATPSRVRKGWRFSALTNSAMYRLRLMGTYASGEMDNGISYAVNVSARVGGNDWIQGIYYRSFAYYAGIEKNFDDLHRLSLATIATPGQRGAQNASTQEVYDLMGDNMYNSNWGYQNGRVRNSRVRKTFEPITVLRYAYTPSTELEASATLLWRTGKNGYTALDWYDAADPRPDYYRNLPSYAYMEEEDYNRSNDEKYEWAREMWTQHNRDFANYQHLNWDRLYNVNYNSPGGRSKYALEERHVDQNDINLAASVKWRRSDRFTLNGGATLRWNRTENYKVINDLLGGEYYLNIDQFAERDFGANEALTQNDLDYYMAHGEARKIEKGGKYGYDYYANVRDARIWANGDFSFGRLTANAGLSAGYNCFWREGLLRKGLFAGLDDNGNEIFWGGRRLTNYDQDGKVISSKGKSDVYGFLVWSAKAGAAYRFDGGHRVSANAGYFTEAPTFNQAFVSPRTRNTVIPNLTPVKTFSADINYLFNRGGYSARVTAFWTKIIDQTDVMSFYDDTYHSFTNFAMWGIDQRHAGIEIGAKAPFLLDGLTISGVLSLGEYIYTSNPLMTQTMDNSSDVLVSNEPVEYWKSSPVYKKAKLPDGTTVLDQNADGEYIIEREQKHYVPSTPQLAAEIAFNYRLRSYWFFELNGQSFAGSYLDMNPLYRTTIAVAGPDQVVTPAEIDYMTAQEKFSPAFLLNASIGKSWYINRKYNFGFSCEIKNMLNNRNVKTGGYEQTRLINSAAHNRYYRFDSKYFYMCGANYMLNLYFRF